MQDAIVNTTLAEFNAISTDTAQSESVHSKYVQYLIHETPLGKSADDIKYIMLKYLPKEAILYFIFLINSGLKFQYFSSTWKIAKFIPILQPGKPTDVAADYRPSSDLSSLSNIFEKELKKKIKIINLKQELELRPYHSTTHQINLIFCHVQSNFWNKKSTSPILLDIQKAFELVWRNGVI